MKLADAPRILDHAQLAAVLAEVTYRPGWTLSLYADPFEGPVFRVCADVPDTYHPGQTVQVRINSRVPWQTSRDGFLLWLLWRLDQVERHECREFFKVCGRPWFDPHDPIEPEPSPTTDEYRRALGLDDPEPNGDR